MRIYRLGTSRLKLHTSLPLHSEVMFVDPVLLATFGTLILLLILTVPIGVAIGLGVFAGMMVGGLPPVFLAQKVFGALDSFPLMAVPFFILAGEIMQKGTMAHSLLAVSRCLVGHIPG